MIWFSYKFVISVYYEINLERYGMFVNSNYLFIKNEPIKGMITARNAIKIDFCQELANFLCFSNETAKFPMDMSAKH